jgi:predicted transcriptional regulator
MANTQFSIRLKPDIRKRLARLARFSGRSSNFLISEALESQAAGQERLLAGIRQGERQIKTGHHIMHEDMKAWLRSWGVTQESPPKCLCGKQHNAEALCG